MSEEFETSNPFAIFKEPLSVPLKLLNLYVMPKQIFYKSPRWVIWSIIVLLYYSLSPRPTKNI